MNATFEIQEWMLSKSEDELLKLMQDPNCTNPEIGTAELNRRVRALAKRKAELEANPFDFRTETTKGESRIIFHLYMLFLVIPASIVFLYVLLH